MLNIIKKYFSKVLSVIIFICANNLFSQSGWYEQNSGTLSQLRDISFINNTTGFMVGNNIRLKTTNGGINWQILSNTNGGLAVKFIDQNTGYVVEDGVYKTIDGGLNWVHIIGGEKQTLFFNDALTGYVGGRNSSIAKTTNGGQTFIGQTLPLATVDINSIYFVNDLTGFVCGGYPNTYGVIFKTINGGNTWTFISTQTQDIEFRALHFVNTSTGYAVGGHMFASSGVIYKTVNGGDLWFQIGITSRDFNDVYFTDINTGYVVGEEGTIVRTTDGGMLWNFQNSNTNNDIFTVLFTRTPIGYLAGNEGVVHKTVNAGNSGPPWGISGYIKFNEFNNPPVPNGRVIAYSYSGGVVTRVDTCSIQQNGFYQLTRIPQGDSVDILGFSDDVEENLTGNAFVPTFYGNTIFWRSSTRLYPTGNLTNINLNVDRVTGNNGNWHIGGGVYRSNTNQGLNEARVYAKVGNNEYRGFSFSTQTGAYVINNLPPFTYTLIADRYGYFPGQRIEVLGNYNLDTINFFLVPSQVIGISNNGNTIPDKFRLNQNYPNPFNPATKIAFDIPKNSFTKLIVFDALGREIKTLVSENLSAGSYSVSWDAGNVSSGLYFYKIISGDFTDTRKMILIR